MKTSTGLTGPNFLILDNGGEFVSRAMDAWAYAHDVRLDFIRPGKPVENAYIESFNGKLRDECLNSHVFGSVTEAQVVLDAWREDYNQVRPHSALQDRTPADWAEASATHVSLERRISSTATGSNARPQVAS